MSKLGIQSIARVCARHPWRTLAGWLVLLVCAGAAMVLLLGGALSNEQSFTNDPESSRALQVISEAFPGDTRSQELVILRSGDLTVDDQQFRQQVQAVSAQVMALGTGVVENAVDYTTNDSPALISTDRHAALLLFTMGAEAGSGAAVDDAEALAAAARQASRLVGLRGARHR